MRAHEYLLHGKNGYDISCMEWPCEREQAVLLCLHGFAGDKYSSVIQALADEMSPRSVRVVTFDWPGHGSSPVDGASLTVENCMSDLNSVIRNIRLSVLDDSTPIFLFATSFGGFLGLNYIARYPDVFSKVVLRSPALNMPDTYRSFLSEEDIHSLETGGVVNMGFDRELLLGSTFCEDLCQHRIEPDMFPTGIPGMIIQGDMDDVVSPLDSVDFAERNSLRLHMINGADHRYKKPGNLDEIMDITVRFLLD